MGLSVNPIVDVRHNAARMALPFGSLSERRFFSGTGMQLN
jgi:hypothetical protein